MIDLSVYYTMAIKKGETHHGVDPCTGPYSIADRDSLEAGKDGRDWNHP